MFTENHKIYKQKSLALLLCLGIMGASNLWGSPSLLSGIPTDIQEKIDMADSERWHLPETGIEIVEYKGKKALRLKAGPGERIAFLKGLDFQDGIIELDIAAIPAYTGLVFRVQAESIYEGIYFRPQNSHSPNPVQRGHTVQYHASPQFPWYHLRDTQPEQYESHADLKPEEWFHVKVLVNGATAQVFVNRSTEPSLIVEDLKHGLSRGSVGLWSGNTSAGTFANLTISPSSTASIETDLERTALSQVTYSPEQDYLFDVFKKRRSVRKFKSTPIPQAHILKILDMARSGPTSGNQQPWKFLVIQDRNKLDSLRDACVESTLESYKKRTQDPQKILQMKQRSLQRISGYLSAPVYVVVLVDKNSRYPGYNVYDGAVAAGYLMVAARALGYGTVFSQDSIPYPIIQKILEIPDNFEQICFTPIGIPESWPESPSKKPLLEVAVFEKLIGGVNYTVKIERKAIQLESAALNEYMGQYRLNEEVDLAITQKDGRMYVQATGQDPIEIFAEARDKFFLKVADVQITFSREDSGRVTGLILHQGGQDMQADKK